MEAMTPLPWAKLLVVSSMVFCNTFMMTSLMPFLTFLVDDLHVAPTEDDIGRYSGYLVSSFMMGQLLFSYIWGYLSDKFGRRPVMLFGLFFTGIFFLSFGFVTSYEAALIIRFATGSFNGIIGATKTYLSEVTDETNQAKGFAVFGVSRGLGMVLGPIVGGFLCLPAQKYPFLFPKGSLFDVYPYALPCVIGFLIAITGVGVGWFVLEETNQRVLTATVVATSGNDEESQPLLSDSRKPQPKGLIEMLKSRKVVLSITLYTIISFVYIQFDELFALWSRLPIQEGGLEFDSSTMGKAYSIGGISLFVYQMFLFSPIERYLGTLRTFQTGLLFSLPAFILLPTASLVRENTNLVWAIIGISHILRACAGVQAFTAVFLMVNNSITAESRGGLNGLGQTLGSLGRMAGPVFAGILFSWSLENGMRFPLDYHFVFILLSMVVFGAFLLSLIMDRSIDQREVEEPVDIPPEEDVDDVDTIED